MKANEAPENIYIQPDAHDGWFMVNNLSNTLVKYTRTDTFMKKACEYWYKYNRDVVNKRCYEFTVNVEDFRKYMEGE